MSIELQAYAFIISHGEIGEVEQDELEDAFLEELRTGKIARPHRINGSSWGSDGNCKAYFFSLPTVVNGILACYAGMGMAAENGWDLFPAWSAPYTELVKLPADWSDHLAG